MLKGQEVVDFPGQLLGKVEGEEFVCHAANFFENVTGTRFQTEREIIIVDKVIAGSDRRREAIGDVGKIIAEEIKRLKTELVSDKELKKVKRQKAAEHVFQQQTVRDNPGSDFHKGQFSLSRRPSFPGLVNFQPIVFGNHESLGSELFGGAHLDGNGGFFTDGVAGTTG